MREETRVYVKKLEVEMTLTARLKKKEKKRERGNHEEMAGEQEHLAMQLTVLGKLRRELSFLACCH